MAKQIKAEVTKEKKAVTIDKGLLAAHRKAIKDAEDAKKVEDITKVRNAAVSALSNQNAENGDLVAALKAVVLLLVDEINILRDCNTKLRAIASKGSVNSIANLKAAILSDLPATPPRTNVQAKASVISKINNGDAD